MVKYSGAIEVEQKAGNLEEALLPHWTKGEPVNQIQLAGIIGLYLIHFMDSPLFNGGKSAWK